MGKKIILMMFTVLLLVLVGCSLGTVSQNSVAVVSEPDQVTEYGVERCADCHQSQYQQWQENAHARSRETLSKQSFAQDSCTEHMTAEGTLAPPQAEVTLEGAKNSITCVVCHLPHQGREGFVLRVPKQELCISCHNAEGPKPGSAVHHPQKEMFMGYGGVGVEEMPSVKYQMGVTCSDCHMPLLAKQPEAEVEKALAEQKWGELLNKFLEKDVITLVNQKYVAKEITKLASHDFKIRIGDQPNSCISCHPGGSEEKFLEAVETKQQEVSKLLAELEPRIAVIETYLQEIYGDQLPTEEQWSEGERLYYEASLNTQIVSADASKGFHNYPYAMQLLKVAAEKLTVSEQMLLGGGNN